MDKTQRRELINAYKSKPEIGGIYCVECSGNQRKLIKPTPDMESAKSRYEFAIKIQSCPEPALLKEWKEYGMDSFSFTCLEELKKEETQTSREFHDDLKALYELWLEKSQEEIS